MNEYNQNPNGRGDGGINTINIGRKPAPRPEASRQVNTSQAVQRGSRPGARTQSGRNLNVRLNTGMMGNHGAAQNGMETRSNGAAGRNDAQPGRRGSASVRNAGQARKSSVQDRRSSVQTGRNGGQSGRSSTAGDPQAKARAKARRRKKQQQRMIMTIAMGIVILLVLIGVLIGINSHMKSKKMDGFRTAGIEAMQNGDYAGAIQNFDEAMKLAGKKLGNNEIDILQRRAEAAYNMKDYAGALETWKTLLAKDSENADYKKNVVLCMMETGQYEDALQIGPMQSKIYNKMALDKIQAGDYEGALVLIGQGLGVDDGSARADLLYNQAVAHENRGNYAQALELFQQYVGTYGMDENVQKEIEFLQTRVGGSAVPAAEGEAQEETGEER